MKLSLRTLLSMKGMKGYTLKELIPFEIRFLRLDFFSRIQK